MAHHVGMFMFDVFTHNSPSRRLRFVSERADSSETLMSVSIPERAGAIREFYKLIYPRNVTELSYRWSDPKHADIVLSLQTLKGHTLEEDKQTGEYLCVSHSFL